MIRINSVLGSHADPAFHDRLHHLEHEGAVAVVTVATDDLDRRRLRVTSDAGEDVAISLPRDQKLFDGAVLLLEEDRALVVRAGVQRWLRISPRTAGDALELGYHCGNLHWRVRFDGADVLVALNGPVETYLARIEPMIAADRIKCREDRE
jgi:urease accessory protein